MRKKKKPKKRGVVEELRKMRENDYLAKIERNKEKKNRGEVGNT